MVLILNNCILTAQGTFYTREPEARDPDKSGLTLKLYYSTCGAYILLF